MFLPQHSLFSSRLSHQIANNNSSIGGFRVLDVIKELDRCHKQICVYCRKGGANVRCFHRTELPWNYKCYKVFHVHCGRANHALLQFFGSFKSFCHEHSFIPQGPWTRRPSSSRPRFFGYGMVPCGICREYVKSRPDNEVFRPFCCKFAYFHGQCLQKLALSSGKYALKCPLCSNVEDFQEHLLERGIYIPIRDASWETDGENRFADLYERPNVCSFKHCRLRPNDVSADLVNAGQSIISLSNSDVQNDSNDLFNQRSDFDDEDKELHFCYYCGSEAIHAFCKRVWEAERSSAAAHSNLHWACNTCEAADFSVRLSKHLDSFCWSVTDLSAVKNFDNSYYNNAGANEMFTVTFENRCQEDPTSYDNRIHGENLDAQPNIWRRLYYMGTLENFMPQNDVTPIQIREETHRGKSTDEDQPEIDELGQRKLRSSARIKSNNALAAKRQTASTQQTKKRAKLKCARMQQVQHYQTKRKEIVWTKQEIKRRRRDATKLYSNLKMKLKKEKLRIKQGLAKKRQRLRRRLMKNQIDELLLSDQPVKQLLYAGFFSATELASASASIGLSSSDNNNMKNISKESSENSIIIRRAILKLEAARLGQAKSPGKRTEQRRQEKEKLPQISASTIIEAENSLVAKLESLRKQQTQNDQFDHQKWLEILRQDRKRIEQELRTLDIFRQTNRLENIKAREEIEKCRRNPECLRLLREKYKQGKEKVRLSEALKALMMKSQSQELPSARPLECEMEAAKSSSNETGPRQNEPEPFALDVMPNILTSPDDNRQPDDCHLKDETANLIVLQNTVLTESNGCHDDDDDEGDFEF